MSDSGREWPSERSNQPKPAPTAYNVCMPDGRIVCTGMTRAQADNKVENERRDGSIMQVSEAQPHQLWVEEMCDD